MGANPKPVAISVKGKAGSKQVITVTTQSKGKGFNKKVVETGVSKCEKKASKAIAKALTKYGRRDAIGAVTKKYIALKGSLKKAKAQKPSRRAAAKKAAATAEEEVD